MSFSKWREVKLEDVVDTVSKKHKFDKDKIILINTSDVLEGKVLNHEYVQNENLKGQFKKSFQKNDILYSEIRPQNKRFAYIDFHSDDYVASTKLMVLRKKSEMITSKFLYQILKSDDLINELQAIAESRSGTFPQITYNELSRMKIKLPPLEEQKAIAHILSTLDDKIEVNNQINKTIENMAQAIFKQWFVDFEFPNKDGEPYKSSGGEMVESELGMIPKGWEVKGLDEIAEFLNGLAMQKFRPTESEKAYPVLKIKELRQGRTDESSDLCSSNIDEKFIVRDGDIIFSWSGSLLVDIWCGGICGLNQHLFKVTSDKFDKWFIYQWNKYHLDRFDRIAKSKATTMGHIKRKDLSDSKVLVPSNDVYLKAVQHQKYLFEKIKFLKIEMKRLEEIRDSLLPKLMSGEIRIPLD